MLSEYLKDENITKEWIKSTSPLPQISQEEKKKDDINSYQCLKTRKMSLVCQRY